MGLAQKFPGNIQATLLKKPQENNNKHPNPIMNTWFLILDTRSGGPEEGGLLFEEIFENQKSIQKCLTRLHRSFWAFSFLHTLSLTCLICTILLFLKRFCWFFPFVFVVFTAVGGGLTVWAVEIGPPGGLLFGRGGYYFGVIGNLGGVYLMSAQRNARGHTEVVWEGIDVIPGSCG